LNRFMQKLVSSILLLIGIAIALAGFGHSLGAGGRIEAALALAREFHIRSKPFPCVNLRWCVWPGWNPL
jgi:hypothetical protein